MSEPAPSYRSRAFTTGSIILVAFGAVHLLAVYKALFTEPRAESELLLKAAALAHQDQLGPITITAWDGMMILNSSYSVLLLWIGATNLLVEGAVRRTGSIRRLALQNAAFAAVLTGIDLIWFFPPPLIFSVGALVAFLIASRRGARTA